MASDLDVLKSSELEKSISNSIYGRSKKLVDGYIGKTLANEGTNVAVPTVQVLVEESKNLEKKLIELYDRKMSLDDTSGVSDEMKVLQATLFDSLVVGVNIEKDGELAIYTANFNVLFSTNADSKFKMAKTADMNREGIVNAVRVDVEYTSEEGFQFKPVSLNKNTNLSIFNPETGKGRFHLVPYIVFQRYFAFFKEMLDSMRVLEVHQDKNGIDKVRYITRNRDILNKYSDIGLAENTSPEYFPLKGFFYAPIVGAPSTTVGMTRVDLIDVFKVAIATNLKVEKSKDPYKALIKESIMFTKLSDLYHNDLEGYQQLVEKIPGSLDVENGAVHSPISIIKYTHGLSNANMAKVEKLFPNLDEEVARKELVFNKGGSESIDITNITKDSFKEALKSGIYKVVVRKKDCTFTSMIVTNSTEILKTLYGEDYFGIYESIGTRLYKLESYLDTTMPKEEALKLCGFEGTPENVKKIDEALEMAGPTMKLHEALERTLTDSYKKTTRKSSSNEDLVLARKCFSNSTKDFYGYIDLSRVVSIARLG